MYFSLESPFRQPMAAIALLLCSSSMLGGLALPTNSEQRNELLERAPAPNPYEDNAGINAAYIAGNQPSVFFSNIVDDTPTQAQRDKPDVFANQIGGRTFKTAFPAGFVDRRKGGGARTYYQDFAQRFSTIFAEKATGTAYVLMRDDPNGPRENSVWNVYERPALENGGKVDKIVKVNPATFAQTTIWTKPAGKVKVKKDVPGQRPYVLDWSEPADGPYYLAPGQ